MAKTPRSELNEFGLNVRQVAFVDYYLMNNNASESYRRAYDPEGERGLTYNGCATNGSKLLKKENVQNYLNLKKSMIKSDRIMETEQILAELNAIALDPSIKPSDRIRSLELLGKAKGMFNDKLTMDAPMLEINLTGLDEEQKMKVIESEQPTLIEEPVNESANESVDETVNEE